MSCKYSKLNENLNVLNGLKSISGSHTQGGFVIFLIFYSFIIAYFLIP